MTHPTLTGLPPSSAREAAIRALALQGEHGIVTALASKYGVHRQKIYDVRQQASDALDEAFAARVEAPGSFTLQVADADIARTVIALRVATPSSIRDEVALLPIIYGSGWSFGKIQALLVEAESRASSFLDAVDLSAVKNTALDEMFSQGKPVVPVQPVCRPTPQGWVSGELTRPLSGKRSRACCRHLPSSMPVHRATPGMPHTGRHAVWRRRRA